MRRSLHITIGHWASRMFTLAMLAVMPFGAMAQTQRWWGLYTDAMMPTGMGWQTAETYHCCAQFSGSRTILSGATLHGVRFYLRDKTNVTEVKVWLSKLRPTATVSADIMTVDVPDAQLVDMDNDQSMLEVALPQPYVFDGSAIYVGYSFKVGKAKTAADKEPVVCAGRGNTASGAFYLRTSKTLLSWNDVASSYGALALQLLVSNPSLALNAVSPQYASRLVDQTGAAVQTSIGITSDGLAVVNSVDYAVIVDGQQQSEQHQELTPSLWGPGNTAALPVVVNMPATAAPATYAVRVTRVNGQPNASAQSESGNQLVAISQKAHRRTAVEEFTGTWCTNCPRGIVGMQNLAAQFTDDFVGIAVHTNDPMVVSAYQSLVPEGIPRCYMDRTVQCDPYKGAAADNHFHADEVFQLLNAQPSEADLQLTATWANESQSAISYSATSTFHLNASQADYALAFVLTEDGMHGDTKDWWQVNGDSHNNTFPDDDMAPFRNADNPVKGLHYDHVAVAVQGITGGLAGSITAPIADGQPQTYQGTLDVSRNTLIQDKTQLTANVLLLSTISGQVVNAAKAAIAPYGSNNIRTATTAEPDANAALYDLQGRRHAQATTRPGLYIQNGKKVIIH